MGIGGKGAGAGADERGGIFRAHQRIRRGGHAAGKQHQAEEKRRQAAQAGRHLGLGSAPTHQERSLFTVRSRPSLLSPQGLS